jgi:presqualene diphosphate synthase
MNGVSGMRTAAQDSVFDPREAQTRASGSSFYAGMRLLPKAEREAMFAIYAFSRAVDDIADEGNDSRASRHVALDEWRRDIESLYCGSPSARAAFLAPATGHYGLRKQDFLAIIDGMDMDVAEDIRAPGLATLDLYCDRVASAVGRLSVKVFGMDDAPGFELAHHLGRALQLTNILRDLDEDAAVGRLYLPREFLNEAGISARDPSAVLANLWIDRACRRLAAIAHEHYAGAHHILRARPRGLLRAPRLMGAVYKQILSNMEAAGWRAPRHRVRIGRGRLLLTLLRLGLSVG